ncbi:MAG: DNA polymerase III subunit gamma/tau [bacterium]
MSWYNKYRPTKFSEVISQDLVKTVLQNALEKDKIKHAYMFSGPKGVGKTTIARIFAAALNSVETNPESRLDIIELDAASNTGIDNIRQLIESAKTPPISGKYRIYIIDEVHMLSKPAMNALLKILEEPPQYLIFLLATTNPEKVIPTVLSRLTKLNLSAHTESDLVNRLSQITSFEGLDFDDNSLHLIAKRAGGSQRDSINLLETVASYGLEKLTIKETSQILGVLASQTLAQVIQKLSTDTLSREFLDALEKTGIDGETLTAQLLEYLIDQSFEGNNAADFIIQPVVDVLSLKLPTNSVVQYLAVIQNRLKTHRVTDSTSKKKLIPQEIIETKPNLNTNSQAPQSKAEPATKVEKPVSIAKSDETEVKANDQFVKPAEKGNQGADNLDSNLSSEKILRFLSSLSKDPATPPPLRAMILPDLDVESIDEGKIILSVSNGFLFTQVKTAKLSGFLKEQILAKFSCTVDYIQRTNITKKALESLDTFDQVVDDFIEPEDNFIAPVVNKKVDTVPTKTEKTKPIKGKFYSIYMGLPEDSDPKDVPVIREKLALPVPEVDDWDKQAKELFELE